MSTSSRHDPGRGISDTTETITVEPLGLQVIRGARRVFVEYSGDLDVGDIPSRLLGHAEQGRVVIALGVDSDHDEIYYDNETGFDGAETRARALEALELAYSAMRGVERLEVATV
jgi:hypothetical protein